MNLLKNIFSIQEKRYHIIIYLLWIKFSFRKIGCKTELPENLEEQILKDEKRYKKIIQRIKKNKKCRVCFYVFEISKWKTDSLFKLLQNDNRFEPFIVLGATPCRTKFYSINEKIERSNIKINYFKSKGMKVYQGYDVKKDKQISLKKFKPDIIFYQQHVGNCRLNSIENTKKYALGCYVPYYVPNYGNLKYDYDSFCSQLFRHYVLNDNLKEYYKSLNSSINNIVASGHTALDVFYLNKNSNKEKKYVIYAPHFSIMHPAVKNKFYYSTFNFYSMVILEFAKKHPELNWVFKPHPNLKESLRKMRVPQENVDDYYEEWNNLGFICENADYSELFLNSKAMITDCGSFLTEYFCTGNPLIHLIHPISINWPCRAMKLMFESFYKVYNKEELLNTLEQVIVKQDDYKEKNRLEAMLKMGFADKYAAENIINDLKKVIS